MGVWPADFARIDQEMGFGVRCQIASDCLPQTRVLQPFAVEEAQVTKREFLSFVWNMERSGTEFAPWDLEHWRDLEEDALYAADAPMVGACLSDAIAYAFAKGGRLLHEAEFEYLLRGRSRSGFVGAGFALSAEPQVFSDVVHSLLPSAAPGLPRSSHGVVGLYGNARELVLGEDGYDSADLTPIIKPIGARDRFLHAGGRIRVSEMYLRGSPTRRYMNIEPAGFRVAYDVERTQSQLAST